MASVTIEVPEELVDEVGSVDALAAQARRALVLDLLREGRVSQGRAARLLGLTRYDILDLMAEHRIVSGPLTAEEVERDLEAARRGMVTAPVDAGG
jgi:predicted HTH domain antitoxin